MINEERFRLIITIIILIALMLYHLTNYFAPQKEDALAIYKISQFSTSIGFILITIYSKYLSKVILGKDYVAGIYNGHSTYYISDEKKKDASDDERNRRNIVKFEIKQSFFKTIISGKSLSNSEDDIVSTWYGTLFKIEENTLYFALELSSNVGEFGILKLTFDTNDVHGFYYSGESGRKYNYKVLAKKTSG